MNIAEKFKDEISKIRIENLRINVSPPIIFFCGGDVEKKNKPSARKVIIDSLNNKNNKLIEYITLAETATNWTHDKVYEDLIALEDDLADFATLIVIILESPGALAELGAFCRIGALRKNLAIIMNDKHFQARSYVMLGPIAHITKNKNQEMVASYHWEENKAKQSSDYLASEFTRYIDNRLSKLGKSHSYDKNSHGHKALFLFQIIHTFLAVEIKELLSILKIKWPKEKEETVKRLLFLLEKFTYIRREKIGWYTFFIPLKDEDRIIFSGIDPTDLKIQAINFYEADGHTDRLKAIEKISWMHEV